MSCQSVSPVAAAPTAPTSPRATAVSAANLYSRLAFIVSSASNAIWHLAPRRPDQRMRPVGCPVPAVIGTWDR